MNLRPDIEPAVLATALATFVAFLGVGIVDPILPSIAGSLGASHFMVELLFTTYLLVMGLAMLFSGMLATRIGAKRTMLLGLGIVAVFAGACTFVNSVEALGALRGVWGLGNALFTTTALSIIVGVSAGNSKRAITLYEASLGFGIACGPLIGGVLGAQSWRLPFAGTSLLMVFAVGFVALTVREPEAERKQGIRDVVGTYRHAGIRSNAVVGMLYTYGFFTLLAYTPLVLDLGTMQLGVVFFVWGLLVLGGAAALAPRLNSRFGTARTAGGALAALTVVLGAMWLSNGGTATLVALVVASGVFCGLLNANLSTLAMEISAHERSAASGSYNSLRFVGGAFAPIIAGLVGQQYGATVPYLLGTASLLLGLCVLVVQFETLELTSTEAIAAD